MKPVALKLMFLPLLAASVLALQVPALADSSPTPAQAPNAGASEVASTYASVKPDTGALAINTTSGSSVFALAFDIKFIDGSTVAPTNLAIAYASCTACQTVAISIQVVIYEQGASTVAPQNAAIAINNLCNLCDTMAAAYQLVIGTAGPVELTDEGRKRLREIRRQLVQLQQQTGLSGAQIQAQVDVLVGQLLQVLQTQLVPVHDDQDNHGGDGQGGSITVISPSPSSRPYSPPPSPSPSPSASPSATAAQVSPSPSR